MSESATARENHGQPKGKNSYHVAAIAAAVGRMIDTVTTARVLLKEAGDGPHYSQSPALKNYQRVISTSDRKRIERAVEDCRSELRERIQQKAQEIEQEDEFSLGDVNPGAIYPISEEITTVALSAYFGSTSRDVMAKHLEPYAEDYIQFQYAMRLFELSFTERRSELLGRALLPVLVAGFEDYLSALLRTALTVYDKGLGELPSIPYEVYKLYGQNLQTADVDRWAIDKKVTDFIAGAPTEWVARLRSWTKIDITEMGADWPLVYEAIQRRHAVIHSGARVDAEYLSKVHQRFRGGLIVGIPLVCDKPYIESICREFEIFVLQLGARFASHFFKASPVEISPDLIDRIIELENQGAWAAAATLCRLALEVGATPDADRGEFLINLWYCKQEMGMEDPGVRREIELFDTAQDSWLTVGKAALLRDEAAILRAITALANEPKGFLNRRNISHMPLMKRCMREFPSVERLVEQGPAKTSTRPPKQRKSGRRR
ncbi:hypothetical protein ABZ388_22245 [Micromonospora parva]|uniref:hypothetical protein n=1 Tax=Micromonospora parva TaxID=1464048 RepID=UPI0033C594AB